MAESIWISLLSNLARRIFRQYVAACAGTIAATGIFLAGFLPLAAGAATPLYCVLVPHFKDDYWLSVGYGLEQEAQLQGARLLFFEAGGYEARAAQVAQLNACLSEGADAILIGAVTSDHSELIGAIAQVAPKVPVFGLVNALHSNALSGRTGVDWRDMGRVIGDHLSRLHPAGSAARTAIFITGPDEAGWTGPLEAGLRGALAESSVSIAQVFVADTGIKPQLEQVETALARYPQADYLIGSAPAIEAAIGLLATRPAAPRPKLVATYVSHTVIRALINGSVTAASFDDPVLQARMAIRQIASGPLTSQRNVVPEVVLLTPEDDIADAVQISPPDYFPAVQ
ncbi:TMAO reductase system periplasmic protein TorT [Roseovarius dicentrarchi]|uniref:TMAO reductase system periplasmic protein TorT n=1 Tax=Roseovarius dicentrarchi TaxID=2250573 RepID=UPI000DE803EB|nr:TMAO reductase system periplasmic protein TorT [Roseovarius dicentrarchi]